MTGRTRVLVLVRHAQAARPPGAPDHDRPLSSVGSREAAALGERLAAAGLVPDLALVSTSRRTRQTWTEMSQVWDPDSAAGVRVVVSRGLYEASTDDVLGVVRSIADAEASILVCGHEPTVSAVVRELAGADSDPAALVAVAHGMRTGAAAILHMEPVSSWSQVMRGRLVEVLHPDPR